MIQGMNIQDICSLLMIPSSSVTVKFMRAGGPGGQKVNKTESAVRLFFNTNCMEEGARERLHRIPKAKLSRKGTLLIVSREYRSQQRNLEAAFQRLSDILAAARRVPKVRIPTKPTKRSQERRLVQKKKHSQKKVLRRSLPE